MPSPRDASAPEVGQLLNESAEWRLLGLLFEYPTSSWRANLTSLLPALNEPAMRGIAEAALEHASEGLQIALFGPAGTVHVREVTHQGGVQFGYLMAELSAYYEAFGYKPSVEEADDHLAVQLGFMSFLKMKQALALIEGNGEHAQVTAEAAASFLKDHLAVQAEPVLQALRNHAPDYLVEAGQRVFKQAGPSPRSNYPLGAPLAEFDDSEHMSCGASPAGDDLIQLQP